MSKRITPLYIKQLEAQYKKKPTAALERKIRIAKAKLNNQ